MTHQSWVGLTRNSFMGLAATIAVGAAAHWKFCRLQCLKWAFQQLTAEDALHLEVTPKPSLVFHKHRISRGKHWQAGAVMAGKFFDGCNATGPLGSTHSTALTAVEPVGLISHGWV